MDLANGWYHIDTRLVVLVPILAVFLAYAIPYLSDPNDLRGYPGPLLARISRLWFANEIFQGRNISAVRAAHEKYGPFVRITPKQVSIADPEALQVVYGYSSGTTKADMYEGFVLFAKTPSMFGTRLRDVHSRKRKYLSHVLSLKSVQELEPYVHHHQRNLFQRWDDLCVAATKSAAGKMGACVWQAKNGRVWFNCVPWFHYQAFDIIGDVAFGLPFGMLEAGQDAAPVVVSQKTAMDSYYKGEQASVDRTIIAAVKTINESVQINLLIGALPLLRSCRSLLPFIPSLRQNLKSRGLVAKMAVSAVARRLASGESRPDLLTKLIAARDDSGLPLPAEELSAEAASMLIAGTDTTANSLGAITFYLARSPEIQARLQKELDRVLGKVGPTDDAVVPTYEELKGITFLRDVINEGMRLHSTSGLGLPRVVPETGLTVAGKTFAPGTEVSCPAYTIHRLKSVWGEDADEFNPDRWARGNKAEMLKYFIPFSTGPRSCLGKHLATVELTICIATIFRRYDFVVDRPEKELDVLEAFLRKPKAVYVGLKRRA